MRSKLYTYVVTLILFVGTAHIGYGQGDKEPPPPDTKTGIPPPVGEPLPIDGYIPYLLILGVLAGASYFYKIERQEPTNS